MGLALCRPCAQFQHSPYHSIPLEVPITEHRATHTQSLDLSTVAAPDPEMRPTKTQEDDCTKSQCVDTSPIETDISIDERSQGALEQSPQLADASFKVTAFTISEDSREIEQTCSPKIVEDSSGNVKQFPHKKTRRGRRGGRKVQIKKQKFYQKMENAQKVSKHKGMVKMTIAEHSKVDRSDRSMTKGKMKREDTEKMEKTAEHIEMDRRNQTLTKGKMKKGHTNTTSAANKRGTTMATINTEAHQEWKRSDRKTSKMTMTDVAHHEWKRGVSKSSKMTTTDVAHHELKRGVRVVEGSHTCANGISA